MISFKQFILEDAASQERQTLNIPFDNLSENDTIITEGIKEIMFAALMTITALHGANDKNKVVSTSDKNRMEQSVKRELNKATDIDELKSLAQQIIQNEIKIINRSMPKGVPVPSFIAKQNSDLIKELNKLSDDVNGATDDKDLADILLKGNIKDQELVNQRNHNRFIGNLKAIRGEVSTMNPK